MCGVLPKAIEETVRMKRKIFIFGVLFLAFLWQSKEALMSSRTSSEGIISQISVPPMKGRGEESRAYPYLFKPPVSFSTWLARGKKYMGRKEFEQAIWAFRKACEQKPLSAEVHFLLGVSYVLRGLEGLPGDQTGWDLIAENEFRTAVSLSDHLPARFNLGMLLERVGRPEEARKQWEHILIISPRSKLGNLAKSALKRNVDADLLPDILSINLPDQCRDSDEGSR